MKKSKSSSGEVSFIGLLFLVFLVLKLTETIDWSWWWVTAPLWGGIGIFLGILFILLLSKLIALIIVNKHKKGADTNVPPFPKRPPKKTKFQQRLENAIENREKQNP